MCSNIIFVRLILNLLVNDVTSNFSLRVKRFQLKCPSPNYFDIESIMKHVFFLLQLEKRTFFFVLFERDSVPFDMKITIKK